MNCLLNAYTTLLATPPASVYDYLGHDGTDKWWPGNIGYEERAFHIQEIQDHAEAFHGVTFKKVELYPISVPGVILEIVMQKQLWDDDRCLVRFKEKINGWRAILIGETVQHVPHACAWISDRIVDPIVGSIEDFNIKEAYVMVSNVMI
jgi:hypothetical protein